MKAKLEYCLRWLREGAVRVVRSYPVETLLALYACIRCLLTYELDWSEEELFNRLGLVPLFFALALAVNNLAGRGPWRKVYWVVWAPIVPLTLWSGLGDWIESASFRISLGILAPLLLLLSLRAVRNDRFVNGALVWLRSGALALLFANVALGLFYAILYSATYIFGLGGAWIEHVAVWAVTICEPLAVPLLFLMMADRWRDAELRGSRILEMLLNYIVTPALLIYAAILYLYMAKILVTWTLPEGGVAYLVFGFDGPEKVVDLQMERACEICRAAGPKEDLGTESGEAWWKNRYKFFYPPYMFHMPQAFGTLDTVATFSKIENVYWAMKNVVEENFPEASFIGHFSHWYDWGCMLYARFIFEQAPEDPLPDFTGRRILLAEDNGLNREIAQTLLEMNGFTVEGACDGREAVDKFCAGEPGRFDAILMDIRMPVMDGLEATRQIRTSGRPDARAIPIIALSANAFDEDTRKSIASGMNGHLSKPIQMELLLELLDQCMKTRQRP